MRKILFVCSGNTCRSPMAQAMMEQLLQKMNGQGITVKSAGMFTSDGLPASESAQLVMKEIGIDLSEHTSQKISAALMAEADLVLTMTSEQRQVLAEAFPQKEYHIYTLGEFTGDTGGDISDPYGMTTETYRKTRRELKKLLMKIINLLLVKE